MPTFFNTKMLLGALLLLTVACRKEDLPTQPFSGTWATKAVANQGFTIQANDDGTMSGLVYVSGENAQPVPANFRDGRWQLSADQKTLTLDFGTAFGYGVRRYAVLGPIDYYVVRLHLREKEKPGAPELVLER